jgi:hypothetical protein
LAKSANPCTGKGMSTDRALSAAHPTGEQLEVDHGKARPVVADTFAGPVHVTWEGGASMAVTPLGQLPFFIAFLKQGGLFEGWVADCPLSLTSPDAPAKRDILGTVLLSVLSGHWRYAPITALRCDPVMPPLLGMKKVVSEDAVRRALGKIAEAPGRAWLQAQLAYCTRPLLREPWLLDVDTTVKPLYGHPQEAVVGDNPHKPGRPSHTYHSYILANLRLVLDVEVQAVNQHAAKYSTTGLWTLLDRLGLECAPWLVRGDTDWGNENVMRAAEGRGRAYLFKLRLTRRVKRVLERAMRDDDWQDAGAGWQGKPGEIRLMGRSRQRRVVLLRRRLAGVMVSQSGADGQLALGFVEIDPACQEVWEYAVLVTSLTAEVGTMAQLYRDRGDSESCFRRMKQTGLEVRPMFHWRARRIEAHVKLCVLALQMHRTAEIRTGLLWARIAHLLSGLKAVRYRSENRSIVQRTKIAGELAGLLKNLGIPIPKQLLAVTETAAILASA